MRWLLGIILVAHGWVHGVMWALPFSREAAAGLPMDPAHSWLLGDSRSLAFGLSLAAVVGLIVAGIARFADAGWWPGAAIAGSALSALVLGLYFSPWWLFGLAIDAAVIFVAARSPGGS
jgi:hypothetical protein